MQFWHMKDVRLLKLLIGKEDDIIYQNERSTLEIVFTQVLRGFQLTHLVGISRVPEFRIREPPQITFAFFGI